MWLSVVYTVVFLVVMLLFLAHIARLLAFRSQTRDGDSFGNRLAGHGPNDEVAYRSPRQRLADLLSRRRHRCTEGS